jgi:hypothetical protein
MRTVDNRVVDTVADLWPGDVFWYRLYGHARYHDWRVVNIESEGNYARLTLQNEEGGTAEAKMFWTQRLER